MPASIPPKAYTEDAPFPTTVAMTPIGRVRSPHKERHGTPRQACLSAPEGVRVDERARLELFASVFSEAAVEGLEAFEYVWVLSWLHLNHGWKNRVCPPGRSEKIGLLATRAPHRPNPIGLSAVRLERVEGLTLHVERVDLLDGTPILDIKPYVPYADAFARVRAGWVDERGRPPTS